MKKFITVTLLSMLASSSIVFAQATHAPTSKPTYSPAPNSKSAPAPKKQKTSKPAPKPKPAKAHKNKK